MDKSIWTKEVNISTFAGVIIISFLMAVFLMLQIKIFYSNIISKEKAKRAFYLEEVKNINEDKKLKK